MAPAPAPGVSRTVKLLTAVGVLAAALSTVLANLLVGRFYTRWDWTSAGMYTLSQATLETLHGLRDPVKVIVLLSRSDPLSVSVRHMLTAYRAETTKLEPQFIDPDRDPAQFLALQQKYGILAGKTEEGRLVTDASIVIARADRHWFVTTDEMVQYDEEDGRVRPRLEQALTEGIVNVLERDKAKVCFTTGHQEISIDDGGPNGIAELRYRLEKNNYEVQAVELAATAQPAKLDDCLLIVVAGPEAAYGERDAQRLSDYVRAGGNLFLLLNPMLDEENRIKPTGLEAVTRLGGIDLGADFLVEQEPALRLTSGVGETFLVTPQRHEITQGLVGKGEQPAFRTLVSVAQSLSKVEAGGRPGEALLVTSPRAFAVRDIRPFVEQGAMPEKRPGDRSGPFSVAMAGELAKPAGSKQKHGPRMVVAASASIAWARSWRDPALLGNRVFVESAVSWLASRPAIVSVPEKKSQPAGLNLTEESLGEVWRYVLLYMPGAALALAAFVLLRRRALERRSRRGSEAEAQKKA